MAFVVGVVKVTTGAVPTVTVQEPTAVVLPAGSFSFATIEFWPG